MGHHAVSGLVGKLMTEIEVHCGADKFYNIWKYHEEVPQAVPHLFTGVKVIQGDGLESGCIKEWDYIVEGKALNGKEVSTYNDEKRTIHHLSLGGDLKKDYEKFNYKKINYIIEVKPKPSGNGSIVSWSIVYEKVNEESPVPFDYLKFFHQNIVDMNSHICESE
ncbi:major latex protein 15-like [Papaver somniferum]|uniref:major latex protein 15-like n=1 Tax=Papaver somniferum TaxID=3469 RepID=UPI000E6FD82B|nr:major latex protein 15-like [Papaver somniferum]